MLRFFRYRGIVGPALVLVTMLGAASCGSDAGPGDEAFASEVDPLASVPSPILFVTQVPISGFASLSSAFGNHISSTDRAPHGGDLHIVYPDGTLRNLTKEAGFGNAGFQGAKSIAVREPSVHWSGTKALFAMSVGSPTTQYTEVSAPWQIYEVTGLDEGETATITRVPNQPQGYNNVAPLYGTDDRVIFTSDRPRNGQASLHPQLDEYESTPTVTGLWTLDPATGDLQLLNHTPSGVFSPTIDSAGRLVFTKWDHLQRDQQADADRLEGGQYGSFNYPDESGTNTTKSNAVEVFPEPRADGDPLLAPNEGAHAFNQFIPWTLNEDGTAEETLNHVGRQEIGGSYTPGSFTDDPNLTYFTPDGDHQNRYYVGSDGGFFHIKEDPAHAGTFFATEASEFATDSAGGILSITGGVTLNAEQMVITNITNPVARETTTDPAAAGHPGHFRNPVPLSGGALIASHTKETREDANDGTTAAPKYRYAFRLKKLVKSGKYWVAGGALTPGISKTVKYYDPGTLVTVTGKLWELDPVEVRARPRPVKRVETLPAPESSILQQKGVDEATLRAWLRDRDLAILVARNVTTRDRADVQQPFNLRVPGGVQTLGTSGKIYDVSYLQLLQADLIRGYTSQEGRRVLAEPMHDPAARNPVTTGPQGSVAVGADGSVAAIVPARRAMTWQLTAPTGKPVVRERNWLSFAPGEIRACPSCHGINAQDQAGHPAPVNPPLALGQLLDFWQTIKSQ